MSKNHVRPLATLDDDMLERVTGGAVGENQDTPRNWGDRIRERQDGIARGGPAARPGRERPINIPGGSNNVV